MDKAKCNSMCDEIERILKNSDLEKKYGAVIKVGRAKYSFEGNCAITVNVSEIVDGVTKTKESCALITVFGKEALGKEITVYGKKYTVVGMKAGASKYPILAKEEQTGKVYKFPDSVMLPEVKS